MNSMEDTKKMIIIGTVSAGAAACVMFAGVLALVIKRRNGQEENKLISDSKSKQGSFYKNPTYKDSQINVNNNLFK